MAVRLFYFFARSRGTFCNVRWRNFVLMHDNAKPRIHRIITEYHVDSAINLIDLPRSFTLSCLLMMLTFIIFLKILFVLFKILPTSTVTKLFDVKKIFLRPIF